MNIRVLCFLPLCLVAGLVFPRLTAQTISVPTTIKPLQPVAPVDSEKSAPPTYELALKWNDRFAGVLTVPIRNDSKKVLLLLGVQATSGLFVGDYPGKIEAGKEDTIAFIYNAPDNTEGELDLIRVLTDQGIREIRIRLTRETVVSPEAREVRWTVGDKAEPRTVTLTVASGVIAPVKARTVGDNSATIEAVNATTYRVRITPASTARSGQFPVFVEFDNPLPGKAVVILGVVQPRE